MDHHQIKTTGGSDYVKLDKLADGELQTSCLNVIFNILAGKLSNNLSTLLLKHRHSQTKTDHPGTSIFEYIVFLSCATG